MRYVNPVIALFLGWAVVDERIGLVTLASATVIIGAVAVVLRREAHVSSKRERREEARQGREAVSASLSTERRGAA